MIEINEKNGVLVAEFTNQDRFNSPVADTVKEQLLEVFTKPNSKLVLNLKSIKFIDSSGFSVLLTVMKAANNNYGEFKICNTLPEVKELFKLLQLHNVFELFENLDDCIASFN
ncbi:STAS domain-containing protein [Bacteroidota bacterium]